MVKCRCLILIAILFSLSHAGCSVPTDVPTPSFPANASTQSPRSQVTDPALAQVVLGVTNQSIDDSLVALTVNIDDVEQVNESFAVEGQHKLKMIGLDLPPGRHTVRVVADSGAEAERSFELPAGARRWVSISYWYFDTSREGWGGNEPPGPAVEIAVYDQPLVIA